MSINDLRSAGLTGITMRYEDGGKVEVYKRGDKEIKFEAPAKDNDVINAFKEAE